MHKRERRGLSWAIWRERGAGNSTCKGPGEDCALLTQELKQEDPASWGQGGEDQVGSKTHVLFLLSTKGIGGGHQDFGDLRKSLVLSGVQFPHL